MEGLQYRPKPSTKPRDADMDELLSNGFWKSSRAKAQVPTTHSPSLSTPPAIINNYNHNHNATRPTNSRILRSKNYKKPVCEDELQSLSKELNSAKTPLPDNEPPARGCIDQHPVLLEADISAADALKYEKQSREDEAWEQTKKAPQQDKNEERRFVFVPRETTYSPFEKAETEKGLKLPEAGSQNPSKEAGKRSEERRPERSPLRQTSRERKESREGKEIRETNHNRNPERTKKSETVKSQYLGVDPPAISRHRSRQELPTLKTQIHQEAPPFQRSVSDFEISSRSPERRRREAPQNGEYLLSPKISPSGKSPSRGYFDSVPRQFPLATLGEVITKERVSEPRLRIRSPKSSTFPKEKPSPAKANSGKGLEDFPHLIRKTSTPTTAALYYVSSEGESLTDDEVPGTHELDTREDYLRGYYGDLGDQEYNKNDHHHRHRHHHRQHSSNSKFSESGHNKDDRHGRSASKANRASLEVKPVSRFVSPLPSPNSSPSKIPVDMHEALPAVREGRKQASRSSSIDLVKMLAEAYLPGSGAIKLSSHDKPHSRQTSPGSQSTKSPRSSTNSLSMPTPLPVRGDVRPATDIESDRKTPMPRSPGSQPTPTDKNAKPSWHTRSSRPEDHGSKKRVGAYRQFSEHVDQEVSKRAVPCPRTDPVFGKKDWLTLQGCPSFDICPSCYMSTLANTEFASYFVPSKRRSSEEMVSCAFGSCPWYHIALLLTQHEGRKDLRMFHDISKINKVEPACLGPHEAARSWHSVLDQSTRKPVDGFNVCSSCVSSIEAVLPALKGVFVKKSLYSSDKSPVQKKRVCDMRFDSRRFGEYFDTLEHTAEKAMASFHSPDTKDIVSLARRYAGCDECPQQSELHNAKWHYMPQLPEFTVCPECYEEVVYPARKEGLPIPKLFGRDARKVGLARCCLAEREDKEWFWEAVRREREFGGFVRWWKGRKDWRVR